MSTWREAIASFDSPQGARLVLIDCPPIKSVTPQEVFRAISDYVNPKVTIIAIGTTLVVSQYIACCPSMFKHAWHICTSGFDSPESTSAPTERVTMAAVFSKQKMIKYEPVKVLHCMKMERDYPGNVIVVDEKVGHVPQDVRELFVTMYGAEKTTTLCPFPKRRHTP